MFEANRTRVIIDGREYVTVMVRAEYDQYKPYIRYHVTAEAYAPVVRETVEFVVLGPVAYAPPVPAPPLMRWAKIKRRQPWTRV